MREDKLFKAVRNVDDDLICEMMEYSPERKDEGDVSEGVMYSVPEGGRTRRLWRYPVTAAVLAVALGALFVVGYNVDIVDKLGAATGEETGVTVVETDNGEVSTVGVTDDTVSEETEPAVSEVAPIVPLKVAGSFNDHAVIHVDSYPEFPQNDFDEKYFTEMSTEELLEYYGFVNNITELIANNEMIEITNENAPHGIYTFPDGSMYDVNAFTFEMVKDDMSFSHRFTLTVGKKTKFGQEYCAYYEQEGILPGGQWTAFYNEEMDTLFSVHNNKSGATLMFSGTVDEITNLDDEEFSGWKAWYEEKRRQEISENGGTPWEAMLMFIQSRFMCCQKDS